MYAESKDQKLYLRHKQPTVEDYTRLRSTLKKNGVIGADRDYGNRIIRVLASSDLPAENIVCLVDHTCYISHLSAMQRWGLTDRNPKHLLLTRPDRAAAAILLKNYMMSHLQENETTPFPLKIIKHPNIVRRRQVQMYETKQAGAFVRNRGDKVRISTIGQTFLDTLQKPDWCGGMSHVLEVWSLHAKNYLEEIITAVDTGSSNLVKSRAGYILDEYLSLHHPGVEPWKLLGQRGSSRKLDPSKEFASTFSEIWMISLNV